MQMKILGIISVDFNVTDQLLIKYFAFVRYWRKNKSTMGEYISYLSFHAGLCQKYYCTIISLDLVHIKLVNLIKICLNES
jgi:hypothetical protein